MAEGLEAEEVSYLALVPNSSGDRRRERREPTCGLGHQGGLGQQLASLAEHRQKTRACYARRGEEPAKPGAVVAPIDNGPDEAPRVVPVKAAAKPHFAPPGKI